MSAKEVPRRKYCQILFPSWDIAWPHSAMAVVAFVHCGSWKQKHIFLGDFGQGISSSGIFILMSLQIGFTFSQTKFLQRWLLTWRSLVLGQGKVKGLSYVALSFREALWPPFWIYIFKFVLASFLSKLHIFMSFIRTCCFLSLYTWTRTVRRNHYIVRTLWCLHQTH